MIARRARDPNVLRSAAGLLACGALLFSGCSPSAFLARRLQQAPNTYPDWFAPPPRVWYSLPRGCPAAFPLETAAVGPPAARLAFRIVEPALYSPAMKDVRGLQNGAETRHFRLSASIPGAPFPPSQPVAGTVVLLHGYALDGRMMTPWALHFASLGWRCALVDLRGHGESTGRRVFFGPTESRDLSQWLDLQAREGRLVQPVVAAGESYGAAVALRWAGDDPRIAGVLAIAPYAELKPAILAIRAGYAGWVPESWVAGAADRLPSLAGVGPGGLDPGGWMPRVRQPVLMIGAGADAVAPEAGIRRLQALAGGPVAVRILPGAVHETLPFLLDELAPAVDPWLRSLGGLSASASGPPAGPPASGREAPRRGNAR